MPKMSFLPQICLIYPNSGATKKNSKILLYNFFPIMALYLHAKNQENRLSSSWEKCVTDRRMGKRTYGQNNGTDFKDPLAKPGVQKKLSTWLHIRHFQEKQYYQKLLFSTILMNSIASASSTVFFCTACTSFKYCIIMLISPYSVNSATRLQREYKVCYHLENYPSPW